MIERCQICLSKGVTCEKPLVPGEAKARIIRREDNRQALDRLPIEKCPLRKAIEVGYQLAIQF